MSRSRNGEAISEKRRTLEERMLLAIFLEAARKAGDLATWRRAKAMTDYITGVRVVDLANQLQVARSTINTWLRAYEIYGVDGLKTGRPPGPKSRLSESQLLILQQAVKDGPQAAGFTSGVWTGPLVREYIVREFGVSYHNHHLPRLLHQLGFSVQRPRKRLARANADSQAVWLEDRLPEIKKKPKTAVA